jgi:hypothetical protein
MNDNSFFSSNQDNQFVLSYELICLLQWLMDHDADKLKKIIDKALASGLKAELQKESIASGQAGDLEEIQENIIDFFAMLEGLLVESLHEHAVKRALERNLIPSIDQIDTTVCDNATVRSCVEKATSKIDRHPKENPKELLFKELLRRWKPSKESTLN